MRSFVCCILLMVVMANANPLPFYQPPANLDTPDDQDEGANVNPQGASSFLPGHGDSTSSISSSSSSEEYYGSVGMPDGGGGSVPAGTAQPGSGPVVGQGAAGAGQGAGGVKGSNQGGGQRGKEQVSDQNSGEKSGGAPVVAADPAHLSKIQAVPKTNNNNPSAGKSVGIAIGVLGLISVATVAIIFTIRKRRDGFMRFYSQANAEL